MPTKKANEQDQPYRIDGKHLLWTTEDGATVTLPLRIKLKVIRAIGSSTDLDAETAFAMIEAIVPGQSDVLDEMDVNEFMRMFSTWQGEYNTLNGASLGE